MKEPMCRRTFFSYYRRILFSMKEPMNALNERKEGRNLAKNFER
jgi:hypothetical protein